MIHYAIASLLVGESTTVGTSTVTRVGLIHYTVDSGPAVLLDGAVAAVAALACPVTVEPATDLRDAAKQALAQYRIPLPADRPALVKLAARLRQYADAETNDAASKVEAVIATMGGEEQAAA